MTVRRASITDDSGSQLAGASAEGSWEQPQRTMQRRSQGGLGHEHGRPVPGVSKADPDRCLSPFDGTAPHSELRPPLVNRPARGTRGAGQGQLLSSWLAYAVAERTFCLAHGPDCRISLF